MVDASQVGIDYWTAPLLPEQLPTVAADLLAAGYDTPTLRRSAGMPADDAIALREVFTEALRELGVFIDDLRTARVHQIRRWAAQTTDGTMTRAELTVRVRSLWEFDEVAFGDRLPETVRTLGLLCFTGEDQFDDADFGRALREVGQDLE